MSKKRITTTFLSGRISSTLIIPIEIAKEYGLDEASHVIVEGTSEGILIKKLDIR
jgi:bifunctional DNA-binding transcriptional regulator/antitoxin component of YhaV-PrlF toxin-antitoxin module